MPLDQRPLVAGPADLRGIYLWAGQATIDLHRVKFPDVPIDEHAHWDALDADSAAELADRGINLAFLSWSWGFPPEVEEAHHAEFRRALEAYHAAGLRVIAYVQSSNCVALGSYADRDWYALTHGGRTFPYFRSRRMTCWTSPEWAEEVAGRAERAIEAGADGVFLDNIWMGVTPWTAAGRVGGFAGCACPRCARQFADHSGGRRIPRRIGRDPDSEAYLHWRAEVVCQRLAEWRQRVTDRKADALVVANNCDAGLRDTRALFGLDVPQAGASQDLLLLEDIAMPRHEPERGRLVANAIPLRLVQGRVPDRPLVAVTYESGIGLDGAPAPRRAQRAIAEAAAVGVATVFKGSEYLDGDGAFSVITANGMRPLRDAIAPFVRWLADNPSLYQHVQPDPETWIYLDESALRERWAEVAPPAMAVALALIVNQIPFAFASDASPTADQFGGKTVLVPPGTRASRRFDGARVLPVPTRELHGGSPPLRLLDNEPARWILHPALTLLSRAYFGSAQVRRLLDRAGLTRRFLESPYFRIPRGHERVARLVADRQTPYVLADRPVLAERWIRGDGARLLHLVNYDDAPARVSLHHDATSMLELHTPDLGTRLDRGPDGASTIHLDLYAVIEVSTAHPDPGP